MNESVPPEKINVIPESSNVDDTETTQNPIFCEVTESELMSSARDIAKILTQNSKTAYTNEAIDEISTLIISLLTKVSEGTIDNIKLSQDAPFFKLDFFIDQYPNISAAAINNQNNANFTYNFRDITNFIDNLDAILPYLDQIEAEYGKNDHNLESISLNDLLTGFNSKNKKLSLQSNISKETQQLLKSPYVPMLNNKTINEFMQLSIRNFTYDRIANKATYISNDGLTYEFKNYDTILALGGSLDTPVKKLLDVSIIYLTYNNIYRKKLVTPIVEIPLKEYGEANGYNLTERTMETEDEQIAEHTRVQERLKEFKKRLRRDLQLLKDIECSVEVPTGSGAGSVAVTSIISSYAVDPSRGHGTRIIRVVFDAVFAQNLVNSYLTYLPTALFQLNNDNPNAYAIGRKIALQNSNDHNIAKGTNNTLRVRTLLDSAPEIISYATLIEQRRRDWKIQIKARLEKAINKNVEVGYIIKWNYIDPKSHEIYNVETSQKLTWDAYSTLNVQYLLADNPIQTDRQQRKKNKEKEIITEEKKATYSRSEKSKNNHSTTEPTKKRGRPKKNDV